MKPFGTIKLEVFVPEGRDSDEDIFADSDTLLEIQDKIEDIAQSFLPPGWKLRASE